MKNKNDTGGKGSPIGRIMTAGALICFFTFAAFTSRQGEASELEKAEIKAASAIAQNEALSAMLSLDEKTASVFAESDVFEGAKEQDWSVWEYLEDVMRRLFAR